MKENYENDVFLYDDDEGTIIGYECLCCGHGQAHSLFDQCERCCGPLDPMFE